MAIRRVLEKDLDKVLDLLSQVALVHHQARPDIFKKGIKYTREDLIKIFADSGKPIFVSTDENDTVTGYAFCVIIKHYNDVLFADSTTLYIDDLCVDKSMRGKGIGKALYYFVKDYAKNIGCNAVTLNVWYDNVNALNFYKSLGLKIRKIGMEELL